MLRRLDGFKPESGNGGGSLLTPGDSVTAFYHVLAAKYLSEIAAAIGERSDAASLTAEHTALTKATTPDTTTVKQGLLSVQGNCRS